MQETNDNLKFPVQWSILTWFITVNSVLTNLCQSVFNLPSSVSNADAETSAPPVGSAVNNAVLFQPTQQSDAASNHWDTEILHFLVYSLLSYAPDSVFNWIEVTDLETKIAVYDNALRRIGNLFLSLSLSLSISIYLSISISISRYLIWHVEWRSWQSVSSSTAATAWRTSACHCHTVMPSVGALCSRSLLSEISSPTFVQFYPEIQPVACMNHVC